MIFGVGKLGGPVLDILACRYPHHRYVIVSRSVRRATLRANLTRYTCAQWDQYPDVVPEATELLDTARTAEVLERHAPDIVFNATTPFPWWFMDQLPPPMRALSYSCGLGMWCALDCALPMQLSVALSLSRIDGIHVNACYPDLVNGFLRDAPSAPTLGIGNISNLVPGLQLAFSSSLNLHPRLITIRLVCHHFTSLNAPTVGGSAGAPYHLSVTHPQGQLSFGGVDDTPFSNLKAIASRVRGQEGQGVTISSAATVLATLLAGRRRRHHVPGPQGLIGGYPITVSEDGSVALDLPSGMTRSTALSINEAAQQYDGLSFVQPGRVRLTQQASEGLREIVGIELEEATSEDAIPLAGEIVGRLNARYGWDFKFD